MPKLFVTCLYCGAKLNAEALKVHACWIGRGIIETLKGVTLRQIKWTMQYEYLEVPSWYHTKKRT